MKELKDDDFIVSKTDTKGRITYVNKIFIEISEYNEQELLSKAHSIIRHPDMPKSVFKLFWDMARNGEEIFAFVLNKTKNNNEYWVYANITPSYDNENNIIGYYSIRRMPNPSAITIIKSLYKSMLDIEKEQGIEGGINILTNLLNEKKVSYNEFIISIQG
jgi:PAS domain S-box-containing protein